MHKNPSKPNSVDWIIDTFERLFFTWSGVANNYFGQSWLSDVFIFGSWWVFLDYFDHICDNFRNGWKPFWMRKHLFNQPNSPTPSLLVTLAACYRITKISRPCSMNSRGRLPVLWTRCCCRGRGSWRGRTRRANPRQPYRRSSYINYTLQ